MSRQVSPQAQARVASVYLSAKWHRSWEIEADGSLFAHRLPPGTTIYSPSAWGGAGLVDFRNIARDVFCWAFQPEPDALVVDIGAGLGTEALAFSELVGLGGTVVSIEAHPVIYDCLARTINANHIHNVIAQNAAIAEAAGTISLTDNLDSWEGNTVVTDCDVGLSVPALTLPEVLSKLRLEDRPISLVKMNIEGAEVAALRGMKSLFGQTQNFAVSCHDFLGQRSGVRAFRTYVEVAHLLELEGYDILPRADVRPYVADVVYATRRT